MRWLKENVAPRYWPKKNGEYNAGNEVRNVAFRDLFSSFLTTE